MIATTDDLCSHVAAHAGVSRALAEQATRAVLAGMGGTLTPAGRELVADELPTGLSAAVLAGDSLIAPIEQPLLEAGVTAGQARELIASVCRVLVEELSGEAVDALRVGVPAALAALLVAPASDEPPAHGGFGERAQHAAQHGSIAEDNPHATTKLSSARGPARHHDTIAEGRPGARYPLSGRS